MRARSGPNTRDRGRLAEQVAADHLEAHGYRIVEKNFTCRLGEIDIIAHHLGELVFVEVRSRGSASSLNPVFSVDRQKQKRIIRAAEVYLGKHYPSGPARVEIRRCDSYPWRAGSRGNHPGCFQHRLLVNAFPARGYSIVLGKVSHIERLCQYGRAGLKPALQKKHRRETDVDRGENGFQFGQTSQAFNSPEGL